MRPDRILYHPIRAHGFQITLDKYTRKGYYLSRGYLLTGRASARPQGTAMPEGTPLIFLPSEERVRRIPPMFSSITQASSPVKGGAFFLVKSVPVLD